MQFDGWPDAMKEYSRRLTELFGMPVPSWGQSGNTLTVRYSQGNYSFKDSKYFLNPSKQSFSHLTTYRGLFGIINSGVIRLYNLYNSNDPNELFSLKAIPTYGEVAENIKPYVYTFSFCKSDRMLNPTMWKEYGQVSINFEIINDPLRWDHYRISPMQYGDSDFVPKYVAFLEEMHRNFPAWQFQPDLESILSLLAFHKESQHEHEQEIRLLYVPFLLDDSDEAQYDFRVSDMRTGMTKFVELPLYVGNEHTPMISKIEKLTNINDQGLPLIRLTSIQFGDNEPRFDQRQLTRLMYELEDYLTAKFGYRIDVAATLFKTTA